MRNFVFKEAAFQAGQASIAKIPAAKRVRK